MTDFTNMQPLEAARVTNWMPVRPRETAHWRIDRFEVTDASQSLEEFRAVLKAEREARLFGAYVGRQTGLRATPVGEYTVLRRRIANLDAWQPVMSDTPNELDDHEAFIEWASGRVLVHGLGLGCVVAALLAKPEVEHIDVVEKDAEVIELTGRFYEGERCTIHHADCVRKVWPRGTRWDCAWHDIWYLISPHNLTDDSQAEHGISYARLHRMFGSRVGWQMSWAWHIAREMRDIGRREMRYATRWAEQWNEADEKGRVEMLVEHQAKHMGVPADLLWKLYDPSDEIKRALSELRPVAEEAGLKMIDGLESGSMIAQFRDTAQRNMNPDRAYNLLFSGD